MFVLDLDLLFATVLLLGSYPQGYSPYPSQQSMTPQMTSAPGTPQGKTPLESQPRSRHLSAASGQPHVRHLFLNAFS